MTLAGRIYITYDGMDGVVCGHGQLYVGFEAGVLLSIQHRVCIKNNPVSNTKTMLALVLIDTVSKETTLSCIWLSGSTITFIPFSQSSLLTSFVLYPYYFHISKQQQHSSSSRRVIVPQEH